MALLRDAQTPTFDERFSGCAQPSISPPPPAAGACRAFVLTPLYRYGKNKVQNIVHLRVAGYAFVVLGRGFVTHFPHQRSASKHHWLHSNAHGRVDKLFSAFGREVSARYAQVSPRTPLCTGAERGAERASRRGRRAAAGAANATGGMGARRSTAASSLSQHQRRRVADDDVEAPTVDDADDDLLPTIGT